MTGKIKTIANIRKLLLDLLDAFIVTEYPGIELVRAPVCSVDDDVPRMSVLEEVDAGGLGLDGGGPLSDATG